MEVLDMWPVCMHPPFPNVLVPSDSQENIENDPFPGAPECNTPVRMPYQPSIDFDFHFSVI